MSNFFTLPDAHVSLFQRGRVRVTGLRLAAPDFMAGLRAVYVTDVHLRASTPEAWLTALLAQVADLRPDLLLLGGDYGESVPQQQRFFAALAALPRPRLGIYGVAGNNDREDFADPAALRACMARGGAQLLLNERVRLPLAGGVLDLAGLDEEHNGCPRLPAGFGGSGGGVYRLLLQHMPRWPERHADLILAGHTHGGQLNFLGLTPFSVGFERFGYAATKGVHRRDGMTLVVSRGLGYSRLPLRVGAYPEFHVLDFAPAAGVGENC